MSPNPSNRFPIFGSVPITIMVFLLYAAAPTGPFSLSASEGEASRAFSQTGYASWYGGKFQGRPTASGEIFDTNKLTAAHKRLPFGTWVKVTNLTNGKSVVVRINDRGPFVKGRIIDLSRAAAEQIEMLGSGVAKVGISVISGNEKSAGREKEAEPETTAVDTSSEELSGSLPLPKLPDETEDSGGDSIYSFPDPVSYTFQIASFSQKENARRLFSSLEEAGLSPSYERSAKGHIRVVLARIEPEQLESTKQRLAELGHDSYLLRENL